MELTQTYAAFEATMRTHRAVHSRVAALNCNTARICNTARVCRAGAIPVTVYAADGAEITWMSFDEWAQSRPYAYFDCTPEDQS